jgi:predicted transposase YdaD
MKNGTFDLKNPLQAWMKFFAEPEYFSTMPIKHYETFEELKKAIEMLDESNFTEGQLYAYDKYMDNIRTQKSIEAYQRETGREEGKVAGRVEGRTDGVQLTLSIINELRNGQLTINQIAEKFQVTEEVVAKISEVISNSTLL